MAKGKCPFFGAHEWLPERFNSKPKTSTEDNEPKLLIFGLNHRTAPVEFRERFALSEPRLPEALLELGAASPLEEVAILSTCNRLEVILATFHPASARGLVEEFLAAQGDAAPEEIDRRFYLHSDLEAVTHLFRVSAGLDSMVLGESQILGQVRGAYQAACNAGTAGKQLHQLFQGAIAVGKRVRAETAIGEYATSVPGAAVELARKIFGSLQGKRIAVLGAGKMGGLAARCLVKSGAGAVFVTNRTYEKACALATELGGEAVRYDDRWSHLPKADIIISTTGCPHFIFTREEGEKLRRLRGSRPVFFIDIAVPRDVDPALNQLDGVFVYDIDDLQEVASRNHDLRRQEVASAEALVRAAVDRHREKIERRRALQLTLQPQSILQTD